MTKGTHTKTTRKPSRRDFLAGVAAGGLIMGMPWAPKAAVAPTGMERAPEGATVASARIYPALGISRVGGSEKWFYAPELPGLPPMPEDGDFKDGDRKIKKQVQRFRVYGFDDEGRVIGELTEGEGVSIEWSVRMANTKAAWYGFNNPLDNGPLAPGLPGQLRNQYFVPLEQRERMLVIDGGTKTIGGIDVNWEGKEKHYSFVGDFWDMVEVGLGELRTDDAGRLLVVPPDGVSKSPTNAAITSFADNNGWHDDWCDGPVTAEVTVGGVAVPVEPSWVACVGPNFAPEIPPISTLYDVIENMNVEAGWSERPALPLDYHTYIEPIFRRVAQMQWITNAANLRNGWMAHANFADPTFFERLSNNAPGDLNWRTEVFNNFRNPKNTDENAFKTERLKIPYMMGDGVNFDGSPLQWFQFPDLLYWYLEQWRDGNFVLNDPPSPPTSLKSLPLEQQPGALTQAALEPCSGGAFHPGVELTYYLRHDTIFEKFHNDASEPFRIAHGPRKVLAQDYGRLMTPAVLKGEGPTGQSPIHRQAAGDLTRWMGLPWQCDAFSCQYVLMQENFPTATWWPALLPIDVLPEDYYTQVMNDKLSADDRVKFFNSRLPWSRGVAGIGYHANASYWDGITNMITLWERMGFVVKRPGPAAGPEGIPKEIFVETGRAHTMEFRFDWKPKDGMLPE